MKKFNELQENLISNSMNLGLKIMKIKSSLPKRLKLKNKTEILELKNSVNEIKNAIESTDNMRDRQKKK